MLGHNNPPSPVEFAREALADLGRFLSDNPTIEIETIKEGTLFAERVRKMLADMEDARKQEVGPLNDQVKEINGRYRTARGPLENLFTTLRLRLTDYTAREEAKRIREAEIARQAALDAEMEARRAEEAEIEAKQNSSLGEVVELAERVVEADQAFNEFQRADRAAAVAERDTHVRLPSQLGGKALSMREKETLIIANAMEAFSVLGNHPKVIEALLTAARDYRRKRGSLPAGITATYSRSI